MAEARSTSRSAMKTAIRTLNALPVCHSLRGMTAPGNCHLVGGGLRDAVLGVPPCDIDVVISGRGRAISQALADEYATRMIELGGDRFAAFRLAVGDLQIDIWDRRDSTLTSDLLRRDLTIHSFALDIHDGTLADPFSGLEDLAQGTLRMTSPDSFANDPLRILRLCRFAAQLPDFQIEPHTLEQATRSTSELTNIASERIRSEIETTLRQPRADIAALLWIRLGVFPDALLGEVSDLQHRQQLVSDVTKAFTVLDQTAGKVPARTDLLIAHIAVLLRLLGLSLGREDTEIADHLWSQGYLTKSVFRRVSRILGSTPPPGDAPGQRWFLHSMGDDWSAAVCLVAGIHAIEVGSNSDLSGMPLEITPLVEQATKHGAEIFDPPRLVTGRDLQLELNLAAGPELGRILATIRRRQIEGGVATREQALELARQLVSDWPLSSD